MISCLCLFFACTSFPSACWTLVYHPHIKHFIFVWIAMWMLDMTFMIMFKCIHMLLSVAFRWHKYSSRLPLVLVLLFLMFIQTSCIAVTCAGCEFYLCDHMTRSRNLLLSFVYIWKSQKFVILKACIWRCSLQILARIPAVLQRSLWFSTFPSGIFQNDTSIRLWLLSFKSFIVPWSSFCLLLL
jgi:hypothetical protein